MNQITLISNKMDRYELLVIKDWISISPNQIEYYRFCRTGHMH